MIKEIYCKLPTDSDYEPNVESSDEIQNILQQVRVVLGTKKGQVLGAYDFGIDLNNYLFQYNMDKAMILFNINQILASYVYYDQAKYDIYVDVEYGHDETDGASDYAVVNVVINSRPCLGILVNQT